MDTPLDFPAPPLSAISAEIMVNTGERVVIELIDGRKLIGGLIKFDSDKGKISLNIKGQDKAKNLGMHEIRLMRIPQPRQWQRDDDTVLSNGKGVTVATEPLEFEIEFSDHSTIDGTTFGFRNGRHGIHLFPVQNGNQYTHLFIPNNAIGRHRIGKHLGQHLIKDKATRDQDIAIVLLEQQEHRAISMGEHLTPSKIIAKDQLALAVQKQQTLPQLQLGEVLVLEKLISQEQLDAALLQQQRERNLALGELLVSKGLVSQGDIQKSLALKLGVPFIDLRLYPVDGAALKQLDLITADRLCVIPIQRLDDMLVLAMADPTHWETIEAVRTQTRMNIKPVIASYADLLWALDYYYREGNTMPPPFSGDHNKTQPPPIVPATPATNTSIALPQEPVSIPDSHVAAINAPVQAVISDAEATEFVRQLILRSARDSITAIHFETNNRNTHIRLRKQGELIGQDDIASDFWIRVLRILRYHGHLSASAPLQAQTGLLDGAFLGDVNIEVRIFDIPLQNGGHDIVLKLHNPTPALTLAELGMGEDMLKAIYDRLNRRGLLLISGPAASGKSTLLMAVLLQLNSYDKKIWMMDKSGRTMPDNIRPIRLDPHQASQDAITLETVLAADPDIVSINPLTHSELAKRCVSGALNGPLILASLNSRSAADGVERVASMGVPTYDLAESLSAALGLRLIKRLCEHCKKRYLPTAEELRGLAQEYIADLHTPDEPPARLSALREKSLEKWQDTWADKSGKLWLHRAVGCQHCGKTGYTGLLPLHELLEITPLVKRTIADGADAHVLLRAALNNGMKTLKQDGIDKVLQGLCDLAQVRAACAR